mmetsp:Transcript_18431/g.55571  ORF Transcript_18431/g.55571 Transcript_18431/m.55571 type:complete len:263 (-) Transcript_18431:2607-3395(-)
MNAALMQSSSLLASRPAFAGRQIAARVPAVSTPKRSGVCNSVVGDGPLGDRWYPGAKVPEYLEKADLPGTYGFDPLGLGVNPENLAWYHEAEKTNGRWAMAACAGILFTEATQGSNWVNAGAEADLLLPLPTLIAIEVLVFSLIEAKRYEGFKKTGKSGFLGSFPFDPAGLDSPANREKEIKNGRLAMMAFVGFASVYANRGELPIQALKAHIADPGQQNIFTTDQAFPITAAAIALAIVPTLIEARQELDPDDDEFTAIPW